MSEWDSVHDRIDQILKNNKRTEWCFVALAIILFLCGIVSIIVALTERNYFWTLPPAGTTGLLIWPLKEILKIRQKNIALAAVPALIERLPSKKAAEEIQKLISTLYGSDE